MKMLAYLNSTLVPQAGTPGSPFGGVVSRQRVDFIGQNEVILGSAALLPGEALDSARLGSIAPRGTIGMRVSSALTLELVLDRRQVAVVSH